MNIRPLAEGDREWVERLIVERWGDARSPDVEWAVRTLRRVLDEEPFSGAP